MAQAWAAWLISVAARSSRLQRVADRPCSAVVLLAVAMTSSCCEGGKSPRPTGPRRILQAGEAVPEVAVSPLGDGVAVAGELRGDLEVGGTIVGGGPQDDPATEDQGLGRGAGADQGLQAGPLRPGQANDFRER